jgi:MOSC domain-containing protein YiiM
MGAMEEGAHSAAATDMSLRITVRTPRILSINAGHGRAVPWGNLKQSAIDKRPVDGPVMVNTLGIGDDEQVDKRFHGGIDQAIYVFAREELDAWSREIGRELTSGSFGENLTTEGIDVNAAMIGEQWEIGDVVLEVTSPRVPCSVFEGFIGVPGWIKRFTQRGNPGAYMRVLSAGTLQADATIRVKHRPTDGATLAEVFAAKCLGRRDLIPRLLESPALPASWREWAVSVSQD